MRGRAGVDLAGIQAFSGHRTIAAVQSYIDLEQAIQQNAALKMPY